MCRASWACGLTRKQGPPHLYLGERLSPSHCCPENQVGVVRRPDWHVPHRLSTSDNCGDDLGQHSIAEALQPGSAGILVVRVQPSILETSRMTPLLNPWAPAPLESQLTGAVFSA